MAAELTGPLGRTRVRQEYANPYGEVIEAVYALPLPAMAAATDFVLEAGGRRIVGLVRPREEAERIYRQARARGQTASLLTQEWPNLFTQSVANVEPGAEVTVELTYFERLAYEDGSFEYVFPMVVGPRYVPGRPVVEPAEREGEGDGEEDGGSDAPGRNPAAGTAPPTHRVPDAHGVTPPVLAPGEEPVGAAVEVAPWGMILQQGRGGAVRVVHLDEAGEAAQAGGVTVEVRFDPGGEILLTAP